MFEKGTTKRNFAQIWLPAMSCCQLFQFWENERAQCTVHSALVAWDPYFDFWIYIFHVYNSSWRIWNGFYLKSTYILRTKTEAFLHTFTSHAFSSCVVSIEQIACMYWSYLYGFSELWTRLCLLRARAHAEEKLHWSQACGFLPLCISVCVLRFWAVVEE